MSRHAAGGKITASHTTIIDEAEKIIATAQTLSEVSKISLGIIKQIGSGKRKIIFSEIPAGFLIRVRGSVTMQELRVFSSDKAKTREALFRAFWIR
ncbi:MAG: hypothetical protein RJA61_540 [Candidatus Parcubacteria bacterium]|jgi:hypothetical protein